MTSTRTGKGLSKCRYYTGQMGQNQTQYRHGVNESYTNLILDSRFDTPDTHYDSLKLAFHV